MEPLTAEKLDKYMERIKAAMSPQQRCELQKAISLVGKKNFMAQLLMYSRRAEQFMSGFISDEDPSDEEIQRLVSTWSSVGKSMGRRS